MYVSSRTGWYIHDDGMAHTYRIQLTNILERKFLHYKQIVTNTASQYLPDRQEMTFLTYGFCVLHVNEGDTSVYLGGTISNPIFSDPTAT